MSVANCHRSDRHHPSAMKTTGFTLVELLVVIGIIAILISITLPAVQSIRESSRRAHCTNSVRQLAIATLNFESAHGALPSGINAPDASQYASQSWLTQLLPHLEQSAIHDRMKSDYAHAPSPFYSHQGLQTVVHAFACPSDPASGRNQWTHKNKLVATTNYLGINGTDYQKEDGVFYLQSKTRLADITDGQSNTLMIGERPPSPDFWYGWWYAGAGRGNTGSPDMLLGVRELNPAPPPGDVTYLESCSVGPYEFTRGNNEQCDTLHYWSYHPGGATFALADGSVHFLAYGADMVIAEIATRSGNEVVETPW